MGGRSLAQLSDRVERSAPEGDPGGTTASISARCSSRRIVIRDRDRETTEIHMRIVLMNRFSARGTAEIVRMT